MPEITALGRLALEVCQAHTECEDSPSFGGHPEEEALLGPAGTALMVADVALQLARAHLITLGGDGSGPNGDKIQKAVIDQIDAALQLK